MIKTIDLVLILIFVNFFIKIYSKSRQAVHSMIIEIKIFRDKISKGMKG